MLFTLIVDMARKGVPVKMTDPRWPGQSGWKKMQQTFPATINGKNTHISIHYVMNDVLKFVDDFKVKHDFLIL